MISGSVDTSPQTLMMLRGILWSCHFAHSHDPKKTESFGDSYEVILVHIVCGPWVAGHLMIVQLTSNKHHAIPSFESKRKGTANLGRKPGILYQDMLYAGAWSVPIVPIESYVKCSIYIYWFDCYWNSIGKNIFQLHQNIILHEILSRRFGKSWFDICLYKRLSFRLHLESMRV